jgi:quinol---cytochrome c reductase iron-sulfur subunit, bacillus type
VADQTGSQRGSSSAPGNGDGAVSPGRIDVTPDGAAQVHEALPPTKPPGYFEGESITRRKLFTGGALAAGGIATAAIALPAIGFALGPVFDEEDVSYQNVGPPSDFVDDNYTPVTITIASGVGEAGKTTAYIRKTNPELPSEKAGGFVAISTRCAHLGCPVRWVVAADRFVCPCHGGVYDFQGLVVGGPPVRPLDRFVTRVQDGQVQLGPRYSVNSRLERFAPRDPGEHLDGLWKYLYPKRFTVPSPQ